MTVQEEVWMAGRAKLNLGLAVTGRRSDGYHLLLTLFHAVELQDWVLVTRGEPSGRRMAIRWICRAGTNGVKWARLVGAGVSAGMSAGMSAGVSAGVGGPSGAGSGYGRNGASTGSVWPVAGEGRDAVLVRCLGGDLVPADERNLASRAVRAAVATTPTQLRLAVQCIVKSIPAGAGLGGGSADAAAAWRAAERLAGAGRRDDDERRAVAARLGADVPFALTGGAALAAGVGEDLVRLPALDFPVVLVKPAFPLATAEVFGWYEEDLAERQEQGNWAAAAGEDAKLGAKTREAVLALAQVLAAGNAEKRRQRFRRYVAAWGRELPNDLAPPVYRRRPELRAWRERLVASSALAFGLTGSGSALFALAEDAAHLERLWTELSSPEAGRHATVTQTPALLIATRLWPGRPL